MKWKDFYYHWIYRIHIEFIIMRTEYHVRIITVFNVYYILFI